VTDLIAFLRARLDEDEAIAREAASALPGDEGHGWSAVHRYLETHPASGESFIVDASSELVAHAASARSYDRAVADHIARHDPARALAEVKLWRRLLLESQLKGVDSVYAGTERETGFHLALSLALKSKAMVYSSHPDYREELLSAPLA
jgi:hypothetical protein